MTNILDIQFVGMSQVQLLNLDLVSSITTARMVHDSNGVLGYTPENLVEDSEALEEWTGVRTTQSNATDSYEDISLSSIFETTDNNTHHTNNTAATTIANITYTYSGYLKKLGRQYVTLHVSGSDAYVTIDLDAGTVEATGGTNYISSSISLDLGSGVYLCSLSLSVGATSLTPTIYMNEDATDAITGTYVGDVTKGVKSGGFVLNRGTTRDPYFATTGAARFGPRLGANLFDGVSWADNGIGTFSAYTNEYLNNEDMATSHTDSATTTINANATAAPDGETTADRIIDDSSTGTGGVSSLVTLTLAGTGVHTFSKFVKADGLDECALETALFDAGGNGVSYFDLTGAGAVNTEHANHTARIENWGGGWYVCAVTFTTSADLVGTCQLHVVQTTDSLTVDLDGTSSLFSWGGMITATATPMPYSGVTTSAARATAVDSLTQSISTIIGWTDLSGTIYMKCKKPWISGQEQYVFTINDDGSSNQIFSSINSSGIITGHIFVGGFQMQEFYSIAIADGDLFQYAFGWAANDGGHSKDGAAIEVDTAITMPTGFIDLDIGKRHSNTLQFNGYIHRVTLDNEKFASASIVNLSGNGPSSNKENRIGVTVGMGI